MGQSHGCGQIARHVHRAPVAAHDHVAADQACLFGGTALAHIGDECACRLVEFEGDGQCLIHFLYGHTQPRMPHFAGGQDLRCNALRDIDGNGEREALTATRSREDLRIDADHFASRIDQRATRIAGVDGGVGLDE